MIGVGVQVVVFLAVLVAILLGAGALLGASWQLHRAGGIEETRLALEYAVAHCEALQAQNETLIERNTALSQAAGRARRLRHDGTARR